MTPKPTPRLLTIEEANQLLPRVGQILRDLRARRQAIRPLEEKKALEQLSWLRADGTISPQAEKEVARITQLIDQEIHALEDDVGQLNALGAQLKDLDEGLVDFFAARGDDLIYLCWKEGEGRIRYWHDLESGFAGRKPLNEI